MLWIQLVSSWSSCSCLAVSKDDAGHLTLTHALNVSWVAGVALFCRLIQVWIIAKPFVTNNKTKMNNLHTFDGTKLNSSSWLTRRDIRLTLIAFESVRSSTVALVLVCLELYLCPILESTKFPDYPWKFEISIFPF